MFPIAATISKNDGVDVSWQRSMFVCIDSNPSAATSSLLPLSLLSRQQPKDLQVPCHKATRLLLVVQIYMLTYAVMLGASSVFMSSFGYQTNLMALAAGGYSRCVSMSQGAHTACSAFCMTGNHSASKRVPIGPSPCCCLQGR